MTIAPNSMDAQQARAEKHLAEWGADVSAGFLAAVNEATDLPSPADDGASDEDKASEPGWHRRQREDDKAEKADQDDDERRIGS